MSEKLEQFVYGRKQLREDFGDCLRGWGDGDFQFPLIGAIVYLFMEQARIDNRELGLTDIWFDRRHSIYDDYFLAVSLGRIINMEIACYDYRRRVNLCICFVKEFVFSGPEKPTEALFSHFRNFVRKQKFEDINSVAVERLKKENLDRLEGGTKLFFGL